MNKNDKEQITLQILENDKKRITESLHDSTLQNLTHIIQRLEISQNYIDRDINMARLEIENTKSEVRDIINDLRNLISNTRPMSLEDLNFTDSLHNFVDKFRNIYKIEIDRKIDEIDDLDNDTLVIIYRIIQEAFNNIAKHANATIVDLSVNRTKQMIKIVIKDNGRGFDVKEIKRKTDNHYGIIMMKERTKILNGRFLLQSESKGTTITIEIPCKDEEK